MITELSQADFLVKADEYAIHNIILDLDDEVVPIVQHKGWTQQFAAPLGVITLSFSPFCLNGNNVIFYYCCSDLCVTSAIESWLQKQFDKTVFNGRWAHCDATTFHLFRNIFDI